MHADKESSGQYNSENEQKHESINCFICRLYAFTLLLPIQVRKFQNEYMTREWVKTWIHNEI